eukprot:CAMPEP_0197299964 /NCGR_PEP_ID=MMETSP0890-20130614/47233_1 /TAXON_ID=44058 ORGANISM="Aureoumbra lagunensis, Strain CCMP1510" /NCGR_SAMPLE_ID=MMETSP0890 /ASSEMBLY_ACC=CAM_ASM_000533 /LENGTH=341 /DNA_ID=CAMNT_0042778541 /DNA_START=97 /DNA_END=1122 /DNA_ORIENTATION=+
MTPDVVLPLASGSKWPAVTALVACFAKNKIDYDTKMADILDWWTSEQNDTRSEVTLRHVLSMTTGMISDDDGDKASRAWNLCSLRGKKNFDECAQKMFLATSNGHVYTEPGVQFIYSSYGFQWAAAAAQVIDNATIGAILNTYVLSPAGMKPECDWANSDSLPLLGGGLSCSARKLDKFVHAMLTDKLIDTKTRLEMETIQTKPSMLGSATLFWGPYCFGNWLVCLNNMRFNRPMPTQCLRAKRHGHPGCFGYYNYVDRVRNIYFNMLPSYTCSPSNNFCDSPTGSSNCPQLYGTAQTVYHTINRYLDDIFDYTFSSDNQDDGIYTFDSRSVPSSQWATSL